MSHRKVFCICALLFCIWAFCEYQNEIDKVNELAKKTSLLSAEDMLLLWKRDSIHKIADENGYITFKGELWRAGSTRRAPLYLEIGPNEKDPPNNIVCSFDPLLSHGLSSIDDMRGREVVIRGRYSGAKKPVHGGRFYLSNCQILQVMPKTEETEEIIEENTSLLYTLFR